MIFRSAAVSVLLIFYSAYFLKILNQKKKGIQTDQIAIGKKEKKTFTIELVMKILTYGIVIVELWSIIVGRSRLGILAKCFGIYLGLTGDILFIVSAFTMKDSWRAGIPEKDETTLITSGIYRFSRNPAFVGFYLNYLGILLMYFNIPLFLTTVVTCSVIHIQVLSEERFLRTRFGNEYLDYTKTVNRYIGRGKPTFNGIRLGVYVFLCAFSIYYFCTCLIYAGIRLSAIWIWPLLTVFSYIRIIMIYRTMTGTRKVKLPRIAELIYYGIFSFLLAVFIFVEGIVIVNMNAIPPKNLDYVIVLGAGLIGENPSSPLKMRINRAYDYAINNENTIIIASGGQGEDELISEAQCIKNQLVYRGIDADRIILEDKSTSTEENLINSFTIINQKNVKTGIISNGFHMARAKLTAKRYGYENVYSVPGKTLFPIGIHYTVRECLGIIALIILR